MYMYYSMNSTNSVSSWCQREELYTINKRFYIILLWVIL